MMGESDFMASLLAANVIWDAGFGEAVAKATASVTQHKAPCWAGRGAAATSVDRAAMLRLRGAGRSTQAEEAAAEALAAVEAEAETEVVAEPAAALPGAGAHMSGRASAVHAKLACDMLVRLYGLRARPELNGAYGTIIGAIKADRRYPVRLDHEDRSILVLTGNLVRLCDYGNDYPISHDEDWSSATSVSDDERYDLPDDIETRAREHAQAAIEEYFANRIDEVELKRRKEAAYEQGSAEQKGALTLETTAEMAEIQLAIWGAETERRAETERAEAQRLGAIKAICAAEEAAARSDQQPGSDGSPGTSYPAIEPTIGPLGGSVLSGNFAMGVTEAAAAAAPAAAGAATALRSVRTKALRLRPHHHLLLMCRNGAAQLRAAMKWMAAMDFGAMKDRGAAAEAMKDRGAAADAAAEAAGVEAAAVEAAAPRPPLLTAAAARGPKPPLPKPPLPKPPMATAPAAVTGAMPGAIDPVGAAP